MKKLFLPLIGALMLLYSCKDKPTDFSKSFALPTDDPQELQLARERAAQAIKPGNVVVGDSVLPDGTRIVNVKVTIPPAGTPPVDTVVTTPPVTDKIQGVGVNTLPWVPLEKLKMFSTVRCYIASGWIWRPGGLFVQPMYQAETAETSGFDQYFERAKKLGIEVLPCINLTPEWYRPEGDGTGSNHFPPIKKGLNRTDPKSYSDYAQFWYQFCARYGSTKHPDSDLRVDITPKYPNQPTNKKLSGLGLIKAVEIGNEFDEWWSKGTEKYVNPQEHVALLIAVIDAIRKADPNMKIVMAGLTGLDLTYLKAMDAAFKAAGKDWPDVVNCHFYTHEGNRYAVWPPTWWNSGATYPELDKGLPYLNEVLAFCKSINRPLWITEYGADTKPQSWMHVLGSKWGIGDEQAQGELLVKTMQYYKKAGVERSYMFFAADEPGSNGGLWQTCGILRNKEFGWVEKPSFFTVKQYLESLKVYQ